MARYVAFLRGINVGGRNRLKMERLRELFFDAGAEEIITYIQSGNVLFSAANLRKAEAISEEVTRLLLKKASVRSPICVRTLASLRKALEAHPFVVGEPDEKMLSIGFLSKRPRATQVASLDSERGGEDRFSVSGAELFLHTPGGMARSKLTVAYFDSRLDLVTTVRNLKTVRAIIAL